MLFTSKWWRREVKVVLILIPLFLITINELDFRTNAINAYTETSLLIEKPYINHPEQTTSELSESVGMTGAGTTGIDESMKQYLALEQIRVKTNNFGDTDYKVVVFDHLVDFTHDDLCDRISKVVLLPNDNSKEIEEYNKSELQNINPFTDNRFNGYIISNGMGRSSSYGHGTAVAGVIHQIAPLVDIISVAVKTNVTFGELKPSINEFLEWLEENQDEKLIINISSTWITCCDESDMNPDIDDSIADRLLDLIYSESGGGSYNNLFFVCAAGNYPVIGYYEDVYFPANLANDCNDYTWAKTILGKTTISGDPAKANGIVSVGAIYDEDSLAGVRNYEFVYDVDGDGDLEVMATGMLVETTMPTIPLYGKPAFYTNNAMEQALLRLLLVL